jgi:Asp-tRNA(Asn)/Glu-tRNA(Gln) amidotransferase A subunit family amidase
LTPTTPCAGWKIAKPSDITSGYGVSDGDMSLKSMEYVYLGNFVGAPAISCPMGYTDDANVPVGLMVSALCFDHFPHRDQNCNC